MNVNIMVIIFFMIIIIILKLLLYLDLLIFIHLLFSLDWVVHPISGIIFLFGCKKISF